MQYSNSIIIPIAVDQAGVYEKLLLEIENLKKEVINLKELKEKRKRRTKEDIKICEEEYIPIKSNGALKPRKGDPIKSFDEFHAIQKYFLNKGNIRDWAMWTIGVSMGLRISDLTKLKINWFLNKDLSFKEYLDIWEKKTTKRNKVLITEAIVDALKKYFDSIEWKFSLDDYVFKSQKNENNGKLRTESGWRIITTAAKKLGFKTVINAHSMRHSFACIAYCVGKATFDPYRMEAVRALMNHSNILITAGYLGVLNDVKDDDMIAVSNFVLGKSGVNELNLVKKFMEER